MSDLPIAKSFFKASALAQHVARLYGLSDVRCQLLSTTMRDAYRVTAGEGDYLLLVYPHGLRTHEQIAGEWQFVTYLAAHGVHVAPAIPTFAADSVFPLNAPEGVRYAVLSSFVPGQQLRKRPTVRAVATYGLLIATIHQRADAMPFSVERPTNDVEVLLENSIAAAGQAIADRPSDLAYLRDCVHYLRALRIALPKKPPFYGLIHGDAIRANAQVADDGSVTVLDFDFCGPGWRAYDVASYLITIRGDTHEGAFETAFLQGYQAVRLLTLAEIDLLPLFEAVRAIFAIGVPARNVNVWGRAYLDASLDQSLNGLRRAMGRVRA